MGILERVSREFPHIEGVLAVNPASSLYLCKWGQKTAPKKPSHSMCRKFPRQIFPELKSTGAEKSRRRKFPALKSLSAEKYRCRKVPVPNCTSAEKYWCRKVLLPKKKPWAFYDLWIRVWMMRQLEAIISIYKFFIIHFINEPL